MDNDYNLTDKDFFGKHKYSAPYIRKSIYVHRIQK